MCDAAGWEAWSYDSRGHVAAERRSTNSIVKSTAYTYNFHGGVTSITYPSGRTINYAYNAAGQTLSAVDTANSITYASNALYNAPGSLTSLQEGANLITTAFYTPRLQPCRISVRNTGSAPASCTDTTTGNVMDFTYGFNYGTADNGNAQSVANNITTARSQTYTYDELNRVSTAKTAATSGTYSWGLQFGYDPWANLLSASVIQGSAYSLSISATGKNQISGFAYDAAGNSTSDPVNSSPNSYTFNAEGELTSAAGVTYTYDGDGDRVKKSSGKLYWYGVGIDPLSESDASGNLTNEYIFLSGARIAMLELSNGNAVNYYIADHLGSSRIVTNSSGTVLDDSDFYPYGGERSYSSGSGNNYKFTGKERDTESGLDDFAARFYSSNFGRFLSADESKYAKTTDPQTWNLYTYVSNNPINAVDPTGHFTNPLSGGHCDSCNMPRLEESGNVGLTETSQGEADYGQVVEDTIEDVQEHEQAAEAAAQQQTRNLNVAIFRSNDLTDAGQKYANAQIATFKKDMGALGINVSIVQDTTGDVSGQRAGKGLITDGLNIVVGSFGDFGNETSTSKYLLNKSGKPIASAEFINEKTNAYNRDVMTHETLHFLNGHVGSPQTLRTEARVDWQVFRIEQLGWTKGLQYLQNNLGNIIPH